MCGWGERGPWDPRESDKGSGGEEKDLEGRKEGDNGCWMKEKGKREEEWKGREPECRYLFYISYYFFISLRFCQFGCKGKEERRKEMRERMRERKATVY